MTTLELRVARRWIEGESVVALDLVPPEGTLLPPIEAGAHVDVTLPTPIAGTPAVRSYSPWGDPADRQRLRLAIQREEAGRGGSRHLFDDVREGDVLRVGAPRNLFALREDAPFCLLLAGGIGITPLLSMAARLARLGRPFALHHAARSRARAPLWSFTRALCGDRARLHLDDGPAEDRLDLEALADAMPAGGEVWICGPAGFMTAATAAFARRLPEAAIHLEAFSAPSETVSPGGDRAFELRLARSGLSLAVPADQSIVAVLAQAGIAIATSCEQGLCGVCLTPVRAGDIDHRDVFLSPDEQARGDVMTPCCSRARSDVLVLDL